MAVPELRKINGAAHTQFLHPNKLRWDAVGSDREISFLARHLYGHADEGQKTMAYLYKELSQLAEIENHVSATLLRIVAEAVTSKADSLWHGADLVNALSCFAAEEIQHANTFYQYVRAATGQDLDGFDNLFGERLAVYAGPEGPNVKLAALCATAYVGESVITVFESRMKAIDPALENSFTYLLHLHGLDEARHVKSDHFVIDFIVPRFTPAERRQMWDLIMRTEALNARLARNCADAVKGRFGVDYAEGNEAAQTQTAITNAFRAAILHEGTVRRVDPHLDAGTKCLLSNFAMSERVHA